MIVESNYLSEDLKRLIFDNPESITVLRCGSGYSMEIVPRHKNTFRNYKDEEYFIEKAVIKFSSISIDLPQENISKMRLTVCGLEDEN